MKILYPSITLVACVMAGSALADSRTHCKLDETDFFTCAIANSNKVVSLCGRINGDAKDISWLQYRFGHIGRPEMIYPTSKRGSVDKFFGRYQSSHGSSYYQYDVWFHTGDYNYSVSASSTGDEPKDVSVYVFYEKYGKPRNGGSIELQGSLNCAQPSETLLERLGALVPSLQPEPDIEN
jgi:hypothetical protein